MFSNASSGGGGGGGCGCGTGGNGGGIWSSGLKKQQKRPKVPKRGPGVAELEKILREQETTDRGNGEGFSSSCNNFISHHSNPYISPPLKPHHHSPLLSPPPPPAPPPALSSPSMTLTSRRMAIPLTPTSTSSPSHFLLAPKFDHLSPHTLPTMAALYNTAVGRNGGASASGGSGLVLPEQALFPINPSSCKSNIEGVDGTQSDHSGNSSSKNLSSESNPLSSYPALPQKRHSQYAPTVMKQLLGSGVPTSSSSLVTGLHNHVEPPSNQSSYCNCTSRAPEEQKMIGMKRPHPSSFDNSLVPPTHFQVSPTLNFSNFSRPQKSSTNDNHSASTFTPSNEYYRDAKWGSPLRFNSRKFKSSDNGGPCHANFPPFNGGTSTVPSPPMHMFQPELCKNNVLPYQVTEDTMEDSCRRSESSSGSDHRPFYSFLEVKEVDMKDPTVGSNHEGCEAGSNGVDLSLKL